MNPACWSRRREVGALWGMSASFTITAIVTSTLKCRDRRFKSRNTSVSFQNLRYPRQWNRYRIGNQNSSLKLAWVFMCLVPLPLFLLLPPWKQKCNFTTDILDRMNQSLHLGCMSHDHISPFQTNQFLGSVMPTIERCKHENLSQKSNYWFFHSWPYKLFQSWNEIWNTWNIWKASALKITWGWQCTWHISVHPWLQSSNACNVSATSPCAWYHKTGQGGGS